MNARAATARLGVVPRVFGERMAALLRPGAARDELGAMLEAAAALALWRTMQGHSHLDFEAPVLLPGDPAAGVDGGDLVEFTGHRAWLEPLRAGGVFEACEQPGAPLVLEGARLYLSRLWHDERTLAHQLPAKMVKMVPGINGTIFAIFGRVLPEGSPEEQREVVSRAVGRRLMVVTGGPGTGKTFVVARALLVRGLEFALQAGRAPRVLLLAPTGKAARRVDESVAAAVQLMERDLAPLVEEWRRTPPLDAPVAAPALEAALAALRATRGAALTLHAALEAGAEPGVAFRRNERRPLDADLVVVDEASMVSLGLMRSLMSALRPESSLTLLGDRDQLQSMEAGSVLADLDDASERTAAQAAPTPAQAALGALCVRLRISRRFPQDSGLGRLAAAVRAGRMSADGTPEALELLDRDPDVRAQVQLVEPPPGGTTTVAAELARDAFAPLASPQAPLESRLAALANAAVLCGHRRGPGGSDEINERLQRLFSPVRRSGEPFDGLPIVVLRNSPDAGVANGDCGLMVERHGRLSAVFDHGRAVRLEMLPEWAPAYALTVHKSQGSEYGNVVVVLPERVSPVLTRELVYTALTRWKASADGTLRIVARRDVLAAALRARVQRASGLVERLSAPA